MIMTAPTIGQIVERRLALRAKREAIEAEKDALIEPYKLAEKDLDDKLLAYMIQNDMQNVRGSSGGIAFRKRTMTATMEDRSALVRHVMSDPSAFDVFTNNVSKDWVKAFVDDHNEAPPGIKVDYITKVHVNK